MSSRIFIALERRRAMCARQRTCSSVRSRWMTRRKMILAHYCALVFFVPSRRRHTSYWRDWSSDVCSSDLAAALAAPNELIAAGVTAGGDVSPLLDKRDQLGLRLAELTGAKAGLPDEQGRLDVTLNGVPLVQGSRAGRLSHGGGSPVTLAVTTGANPPVAVPTGT